MIIKIATLFIVTLLTGFGCANPPAAPATDLKLDLVHHRVSSSSTHNPNSTWWGYNMSKIVRHGDTVYYGVIEGDSGVSNTLGDFNIYQIRNVQIPEKIVSLRTSRPGNILVDSAGALHVILFEPHTVAVNDSIGSLVHYEYPDAALNNFSAVNRLVIKAAPDAMSEVVNIRIGASINAGDTLIVSHGLNFHSGSSSKAVVIYQKSPTSAWSETALTNLAHEFYYPFIYGADDGKVFVLPVQDDYVAGPPVFNRYYKIPLFVYDGSSWTSQMLLDLSGHPLAVSDTRPHLVEQSELVGLSNGNVLAIVKDKSNADGSMMMEAVTISANGSVLSRTPVPDVSSTNWLRAFEIGSELYYFGVTWDRSFFMRASDGQKVFVELDGLKTGAYIYLSSGRGGAASRQNSTLDILAVSGNSANYPSPEMDIYSISKSTISRLFGP